MSATLFFCALLASPLVAAAGGQTAAADVLLRGGTIVTLVDPEAVPAPTAVAIRGERIVYVGDEAGAESWIGAATSVVDLDGAVVVPGLIDGHAHLHGLGKALDEVDLRDTVSAAECVELVAAAAATLPAGQWLQGRGWDQNDWPVKEFPTRAMLDAEAPELPVGLRRIDGHASWVNSAALRAAGITAATPSSCSRTARRGSSEV